MEASRASHLPSVPNTQPKRTALNTAKAKHAVRHQQSLNAEALPELLSQRQVEIPAYLLRNGSVCLAVHVFARAIKQVRVVQTRGLRVTVMFSTSW